ncbi:PTS sugar transporter subunit IIA [bacterium]|nr:PTS sugar transporter subunit IIA [bacterium]
MQIYRLLSPELIEMDLDPLIRDIYEKNYPNDYDDKELDQRKPMEIKEIVLTALTRILERTDRVQNPSKLVKDLLFREKKASTGIGLSIAIPHIRTMQVKDFVIGFGRSNNGILYDAIDNLPVHLFFPLVAPPYDDREYLKVLRKLTELLQFEHIRDCLLEAEDPGEVIRILKSEE